MWKSSLSLSAGMAGIDCAGPQHLRCHDQHGQKSPFCLQRSSALGSPTQASSSAFNVLVSPSDNSGYLLGSLY